MRRQNIQPKLRKLMSQQSDTGSENEGQFRAFWTRQRKMRTRLNSSAQSSSILTRAHNGVGAVADDTCTKLVGLCSQCGRSMQLSLHMPTSPCNSYSGGQCVPYNRGFDARYDVTALGCDPDTRSSVQLYAREIKVNAELPGVLSFASTFTHFREWRKSQDR